MTLPSSMRADNQKHVWTKCQKHIALRATLIARAPKFRGMSYRGKTCEANALLTMVSRAQVPMLASLKR
jgi:hypothetical protein